MTEIVIPVGGLDAGVGISGLEAVHRWDDTISLNEQDYPRIKLDKITGLYGNPDAAFQQDPLMGRIGEVPRVAFKRGRTLTYEGRFMGRSRPELRQLLALAGFAFSPMDERQMVVSLNTALGGDQYSFFARVLDYQAIEESAAAPQHPTQGWLRSMTLSLRMSDPRFYALDGITETVPRGPSGHTCTNPGNAPTDPVVVLSGPYDACFLKNANTQGSLHFTTPLTTGKFLIIDFKHRTISDQDGLDARSHLDLVGSTWWDAGVAGLLPGDNSCFLTVGSGSSSSTQAVFNYKAAYWS